MLGWSHSTIAVLSSSDGEEEEETEAWVSYRKPGQHFTPRDRVRAAKAKRTLGHSSSSSDGDESSSAAAGGEPLVVRAPATRPAFQLAVLMRLLASGGRLEEAEDRAWELRTDLTGSPFYENTVTGMRIGEDPAAAKRREASEREAAAVVIQSRARQRAASRRVMQRRRVAQRLDGHMVNAAHTVHYHLQSGRAGRPGQFAPWPAVLDAQSTAATAQSLLAAKDAQLAALRARVAALEVQRESRDSGKPNEEAFAEPADTEAAALRSRLQEMFARVTLDAHGGGRVGCAELISRLRQDGELASVLRLPTSVAEGEHDAFAAAFEGIGAADTAQSAAGREVTASAFVEHFAERIQEHRRRYAQVVSPRRFLPTQRKVHGAGMQVGSGQLVHRPLSSMACSELIQYAEDEGIDGVAIDRAIDSRNPRDALLKLMEKHVEGRQAYLETLKVSELVNKAENAGVAERYLDEAQEQPTIEARRDALVKLLLAFGEKRAVATAGRGGTTDEEKRQQSPSESGRATAHVSHAHMPMSMSTSQPRVQGYQASDGSWVGDDAVGHISEQRQSTSPAGWAELPAANKALAATQYPQQHSRQVEPEPEPEPEPEMSEREKKKVCTTRSAHLTTLPTFWPIDRQVISCAL